MIQDVSKALRSFETSETTFATRKQFKEVTLIYQHLRNSTEVQNTHNRIVGSFVTRYRVLGHPVNFKKMFSAPCIIVYQYTETDVVYFLLNLLRIKGLCMFRALTCSSSENAAQMAFGTLRVCYVMYYDVTRTHYTKCGLCSDSCG
jgi:hypothetical protein